MSHFKEIWFDLDGTLGVITENWNKAHDNFRYSLFAKHFDTDMVTDEIIDKYESLYGQHKSNSAVFASLGYPADYWMNQVAQANLYEHYEPRDDVSQTLQTLARRACLGIFTNNTPAIIDKTLERLGLPRDLFAKVLSADEAKARKPHPHGFEIMLSMAECEPQELLYIGDRFDVDVAPVQKLGAKGALVWSTDERADYNFPQFTDLLELNKN